MKKAPPLTKVSPSTNETLRFIFFGDLVGEPGVAMFKKWAPKLQEKHRVDAIVVNGENSFKNGRGIAPESVKELQEAGASVITSGNHVWSNKKIYSIFEGNNEVLLRPANYPSSCPGRGYALIEVNGHRVAVINLQGRVFMHEDLDCPFRTVETLLSFIKSKTDIIFIDFHAEATSEKQAMLHFLDGKVTGLYGTHTHVQTADEQITPQGTSYISDLGFSGAKYSALGVSSKIILDRFLTQMPNHFKVEKKGPMIMNGVFVEVDAKTGKALKIERIKIVDEEIENNL